MLFLNILILGFFQEEERGTYSNPNAKVRPHYILSQVRKKLPRKKLPYLTQQVSVYMFVLFSHYYCSMSNKQ